MKIAQETIERVNLTNNYWYNIANRVINFINVRESEGKETKLINLISVFDEDHLIRLLLAKVLYREGKFVRYNRDNISNIFVIAYGRKTVSKRGSIKKVKRIKGM